MESFNFNTCRHLGRQCSLGLLCLTLQLTHRLEILGDIDVVLFVVLLGEVVDDSLIEILTTQMGIASG